MRVAATLAHTPTSAVPAALTRDVEASERSARDAELDRLTPAPEVLAAIALGARGFEPTDGDRILDAAIQARRAAVRP